MAMLNGDQTKATFGPEWLSFKSGPSISEDDQSNQYNGAIKGGQRTHYSPTKKVPLRFTRSKSTPLLPVDETQGGEGQISKEKKTEDVAGVGGFAMLKERNLFDRNFPTLNTQKPRLNVSSVNLNTNFSSPPPSTNPSPPTSVIKSEATPSSAWKIPQSKANPLTNSPPNGVSISPNGREGVETEMQLASLIVPNVQPPKVLTKNRVELLTKKGPPKKKFDASLLRKATSEPNLPIPPAYQENYAKLMAAARKGAPDPKHPPPKVIPEREKKLGTVVLNRNDFFKGRLKKESTSTSPQDESTITQHRRVASDEWVHPTSNPLLVNPGEDDESPHTPIPTTIITTTTEERTPSGSSSNANIEPRINGFTMQDQDSKHVNSNPIRSRSVSPKLLSLEDEEKFLRNLGWAPEEEVHVPELSEEEIVEWEAKKLFWMSQMTQRKRLSLDVCIRKWQNDREGMFVTKIY